VVAIAPAAPRRTREFWDSPRGQLIQTRAKVLGAGDGWIWFDPSDPNPETAPVHYLEFDEAREIAFGRRDWDGDEFEGDNLHYWAEEQILDALSEKMTGDLRPWLRARAKDYWGFIAEKDAYFEQMERDRLSPEKGYVCDGNGDPVWHPDDELNPDLLRAWVIVANHYGIPLPDNLPAFAFEDFGTREPKPKRELTRYTDASRRQAAELLAETDSPDPSGLDDVELLG